MTMLHGFLVYLLALTVTPQSATTDRTPDEWARGLNDQRFSLETYHGLPWEEYSLEGFFPRESPHRIASDRDTLSDVLPTRTTDNDAPTKTKGMHLMPRGSWDASGCALDGPLNCFTFSC